MVVNSAREAYDYARTLALAYVAVKIFSFLRRIGLNPRGLIKAIGSTLLSGAGAVLPGNVVGGLVKAAVKKEIEGIEKELLGDGDPDARTRVPEVGLSARDVINSAKAQKELQKGFADGIKWGGIYHDENKNGGDHLGEVQHTLWKLFNNSNLLYPDVFPGIRKFEAEVTEMVLSMVGGGDGKAVGLLSSGGTESILIAVLAYREKARSMGIAEPEIVCAITAHPALYKACKYFNVKLVKVGVDASTGYQLSPKAAEAHITRSTVAIYASAPTFTHGVMDPVEDLAKLAQRRNVGLHVDNCLGGFLTSYLQKAGLMNKRFDFSVEGVTTMSIDVHKYGFASKGVSVVCFRDPALRQLTYVPSVDGCEGLYVTPTLQGSRPGGVVAQAWGTLLCVGESGYLSFAKRYHAMVQKVKDVLSQIPELELLVEPDAACVPISSSEKAISIYQVATLMEKKGWNMFTGQHPPVMTLCLGEQHLRVLDRWGDDLVASVQTLRENPNVKLDGHAAVYGAAATVPDDILDAVLRSYVDVRMRVKPKKA